MAKYLPWLLVVLLGIGLGWAVFGQQQPQSIGIINVGRITTQSTRAQELSQQVNERYNELVAMLNEEIEAGVDPEERAEQERLAYSEYLAYRQELEVQFQQELDRVVQAVAEELELRIVVDDDVVRFGGIDISDDIITRLE